MTFDPDTLDNTALMAVDHSTLTSDELQDLLEAQNASELNGDAGIPQADMPTTDPAPSLDPTPVAAGVSPDGTGWVINFDNDGAVHTVPTGTF